MGRKSRVKADRRVEVERARAAEPIAPLNARRTSHAYPEHVVVLDEIARLDRLHKDTKVQLDVAVNLARQRNVSWTVIGGALGVSRQAARRRFEGKGERSEPAAAPIAD